MPLTAAIESAGKLKDALEKEVERTRDARTALKSLDAVAIFERASLRDAFNTHAAFLSRELARGLGAAASELGVSEVTLKNLTTAAPEQAAVLSSAFAQIRALSAALLELDAFNKSLAERTLSCVRAYTAHLSPRAVAYDRRGVPTPAAANTRSELA